MHVDKVYRTREKPGNGVRKRKYVYPDRHWEGLPVLAGIDKKILRAKRKQEQRDESIRQAIEGVFLVSKRRYGLDCGYEKLKITSETTIMVNMLVMNVEKILKDLYAMILSWLQLKKYRYKPVFMGWKYSINDFFRKP